MRCKNVTALLLFIVLNAAPENLSANVDLYVSPQGSDNADGGVDTPLASLVGARDRVRQLGVLIKPVNVWFNSGTYWFPEPVVFDAEDSGSADAPILYRSLPEADVRFSGGQLVSNWVLVADPEILRRLPEEARDHVLVADLKAQGIVNYGRIGRRGSGRGIPQEERGWIEAELFWDDEPMTLARWPNSGFRGIHEVDESHERITIDSDRLTRWVDDVDPWILAYWLYDWAELYEPIVGLEADNQVVLRSSDITPGYGIDPGRARWYAFNLLSEIDRPGEYYIDRVNGLLYVWPPTPVGRAVLSQSGGLIRASNLNYVTFQGITFEVSRSTAVVIDGGNHCKVVASIIRNTGERAVQVNGGVEHEVYGCDIYATGTGGIHMSGGNRTILAPSGHNAENNHVHHYARRKRTYMPAIGIHGVGGRIAHNLIHDGPHMALTASGNDHILEYNEIHNVVYESRDAGAFYVGRDFTQRGTVLRYNYWHQILGADGHGGMTIYLDDQHSGHIIHGNLFESVTNAVFIGGGVDNTVTNNVFIDCWKAAHLDTRGMGWQKNVLSDTSWTFHRGFRAVPYKSEIWAQRYPTLPGILEEEGLGVPKRNLFSKNISAGGIWDDINRATRQFQTITDNLTFDEDPEWAELIKDHTGKPVTLNFRNSAAVDSIGFEPLPVQKMGLYADARRASWPVKHEVRPVTFAEPEPQVDLSPDPIFVVAPSDIPVTIDGQLKSPEFDAQALDKAMVLEANVNGALADPPVWAWLTHDGTVLLVGLKTAVSKTRDLGNVWGRSDAVELAFKPDDDFYAEKLILRGYADGSWETTDEAGTSRVGMNRIVQGVQYAAWVGEDIWSAEWSIPLENLSKTVGDFVQFNLTVRRVDGQRWIMWRPTGGHSYDVESVGRLQFAY